MTPEDVARRYESKPGYELIDYVEVGLPIYRLTVDSVTMVRRELPPILEFVMKSISAGISWRPEIGGFLGIDAAVVDASIAQLSIDRFITQDSEGELSLTDRGKEVLSLAYDARPQDEMLSFLYDRLLLRPKRLLPETLLVPAQVDPKKMIQIRAYPAEGPEIKDISIQDLTRAIHDTSLDGSNIKKDILRLKRIVRRVRLYRPAVGLVYKKSRSSEIQIDFVIDDARDMEISNIFSERGGPKKMGFIKSVDQSTTASDLRRYLGKDVQALLPEQAELDGLQLAVSTAKIKQQAARTKAERATERDGSVPKDAREALEAADQMLRNARMELNRFQARPVAPFELSEMLNEALCSAKSQLLISSYQVDDSVVDAIFLKRLQLLLEEGVRVVFTLSKSMEVDNDAIIALERLRRNFPKFEIAFNPDNRRFFHLVVDDSLALVSNRSFLGVTEKARKIGLVVGYVLQKGSMVEAFRNRVDKLEKSPARQQTYKIRKKGAT